MPRDDRRARVDRPVSPNRRITRAEVIASDLRDRIARNELEPGTPIRERALAEQFAVSRTPLREALRILAAEHLVELLPNRGAVVCSPNAREIQDLLSVLGVLEGLAGEQAAANISDPEIAEIKGLHYEMRASFERGNRFDYFKLNQAIHKAIVAGSHNNALIEVHAQTNARVYRARYLSSLRNENWKNAIEEHEEILMFLVSRDVPGLSAALRRHMDSAWHNVSGHFASPAPR